MIKRIIFSSCLLFSCCALAQFPSQQEFAAQTAKKYPISEDHVSSLLQQANKNQKVLDAISRPWEAKPWYKYWPIFLTEKRIKAGVKFWLKHQTTLERVEKELGVDAAIVVAIIGVETFYGTYKGKYKALDSLYTLGFHHQGRGKFFRKQLAELMVLSNEEQLDIHQLYGSYAGAMGWGQFIPSSYRHYAIDFDGDNKRDLFNNEVDAIGSVGNYFKQHKWQFGEPVAFPAKVKGNTYQTLLRKKLKPVDKVAAILDKQVYIEADVNTQAKGQLLELETETGVEHWLTLNNFYVISRYNHSPLYSMAVYQLSEKIKAAKQQVNMTVAVQP
ncbi:lytic murein transglycosylase B [Saccharobesus litoralis]|uniref:Lytic murein transglycosylase B n=1 Tax=Saccharobesus litoralis TaxID=2172099 RepID=A0A2S0VVT1_9ALTE|nr:lytic murein transglycosylase B [Saccharobesus litoralis]AWB68282.1 lytic murein transglycosylase B [Saccharobesus litoralis]